MRSWDVEVAAPDDLHPELLLPDGELGEELSFECVQDHGVLEVRVRQEGGVQSWDRELEGHDAGGLVGGQVGGY